MSKEAQHSPKPDIYVLKAIGASGLLHKPLVFAQVEMPEWTKRVEQRVEDPRDTDEAYLQTLVKNCLVDRCEDYNSLTV